MEKLLSASLVTLPCITINCMRDMVKGNIVFIFPLLFMDIFWHFNVDLSSEQQVLITVSDVINGDIISQSDFEYNETDKG